MTEVPEGPKLRTNSSKAVKYKSDLNNLENPDYITINDDFIPKCSFNFAFDLANKCYKPLFEENNEKEKVLNEMLKFQALKKFNNFRENFSKSEESKTQTEKDYDSNESEESENEERESSSISESESIENSNKSNIKRFQSMNINKVQKKVNIHKTIQRIKRPDKHQIKQICLTIFIKLT